MLGAFVAALPALAQAQCKLSDFNVTLQSTGTGPFNTADACTPGGTAHVAGNDACTTDNVVRTNDTYIYRFNYKIGAGFAESNITFTSVLPLVGGKKIAIWDSVPAQCSGPGSNISTDGSTLVCNIGGQDQTAGGDLTAAVLAPAKVTIFGANGTQNVATTTSTTDNCTAAQTPKAGLTSPVAAPVVEISARQKVDFRKDVLYTQQSGYTYNGVQGYLTAWYVYADQYDPAGASSKGGEAITSPITMTDIATNFPPNAIWFDCYRVGEQGIISCPARGTPASQGGVLTLTAGSGEADQFLIAGGKGTAVEVNAFTSAPQRLATHAVRFWLPLSDINTAANQTPPGSGQINLNNRIDNFGGTSASGAALVDQLTTNNALTNTVVATAPGSYYKYVARDWGNSRWAYENLAATSSGKWQLESTDNWGDSGTALVYPGQIFFPRLDYYNPSAAPTNTTSTLCDNFDNTQVEMAIIPGSGGHAAGYYYSAPNEIAFGNPGNVSTAFPQGYRVQYGVANTGSGNPGAAHWCRDEDAQWFDTVTAAQAQGKKDLINKVRMIVPSLGDGQNTLFVIAHKARPGINGTYYPDYSPYQLATVNNGNWVNSGYNVGSNTGLSTGKRVQITTAIARVLKNATINGNPTSTAIAGGSVTYTLVPSIQSIIAGLPTTYVTLVDRLPAPLTYVDGSAKFGAAIFAQDSIQSDAAGTTLTWTINGVTPNVAINTASFVALVPLTVAPNSSVVNQVEIQSPDDASPASQRRATKAVTVLNPPGLKVFKSTSTPLIEPNGTAKFKLDIANFEDAPTVIDVIDVIPHLGDNAPVTQAPLATQAGRNPVSAFAGTIGFSATSITAPAGSVVRYKKGPVNAVLIDPRAVSNTASAADGWCLPAEFGTGTCPANFSDVVAFRVSNMTVGGNAVSSITADLPTNQNTIGDRYVNRFGIRSSDPAFAFLRSNDVPVRVVLGSLAGKVYRDDDGNGTQNSEPSLPNVTVTLCLSAPVSGVCAPADVAATTVTDGAGAYQFSNLISRPYWIVETKPREYGNGPTNAVGSTGGAASPNLFASINLPIGANGANYNFGHRGIDLVTTVQLPATPAAEGAVVLGTVTFGNITPTPGENTTLTVVLTPGLPAASVSNLPPGFTATPYDAVTGIIRLIAPTSGLYANGAFPPNAQFSFNVAMTTPAAGTVTLGSRITNTVADNTPITDPTSTDVKRNAHQAAYPVLSQQIDVRKRVGAPRQLTVAERTSFGLPIAGGEVAFAVPYRIVVANRTSGAMGLTATNVQLADNLADTFGTNLITVLSVDTPTLTTSPRGAKVHNATAAGSASAAQCAAPSAGNEFNGNTKTNLLRGDFNLAPGEQCLVEFVAIIDFVLAPVPAVAKLNTAFAYSGTAPNTANTPFVAGVPTYPATVKANDASTDNPQTPPDAATENGKFPSSFPPPPTNSNTDAADPTPVSFAEQKIDVRKSSSYPVQTDLSGRKFRIYYTTNVTNTAAAGGAVATNVQLSENLKFTFPAPAVFSITPGSVQLLVGAGSTTTCVVNAGFNGSTNYNLLGTGSNPGVSAVNLSAGDKCIVTFAVDVDYTNGVVPLTSAPQNRIFASTANVANSGPPFDAAGLKSGDNPAMISKDTSANVNPPVRPYGAPPADPGAPASKSDTGSGTPAIFKTIEVVKAVSGQVEVVSSGKYRVTYRVRVTAVGPVGEIMPNVQVIDNLKQAYDRNNTGVPSINVTTAPVVASGICTANAAFNGTTDQKLLSGGDSFTVGNVCEVSVKGDLDYGANAVVAGPHFNQVYASSSTTNPNVCGAVSTNAATSTTLATSAGGSVSGVYSTSSFIVGFDASTDNGAVPTAAGSDKPLPTPVSLPPPPVINAIKYAENSSRPGRAPRTGDVVSWVVVYKNDGTTVANDVQIRDAIDTVGFTNPVIASASRIPENSLDVPTPNGAYNGVSDVNLLGSVVGLAPGEYIRVVVNATVKPAYTGPVRNQSSLIARELGGAGGTKVLTSGVNGTGYPACPNVNACIPTSVTVPATALVTAPVAPGAKGQTNTLAVTAVANISGKVFLDTNYDGVLSAGEGAIDPFVKLDLCRVATVPCPTGQLEGTTNTNGSGDYSFGLVPPGTYFVQQTQPSQYGSSSPNQINGLVMAGVNLVNNNFGETLGQLTGRVYRDEDASGTYGPTDKPIPNVTVKLCLSSDAGCASPVQVVTTNAAGVYDFKDLLPPPAGQTYSIVEDQLTVPTNLSNGTTTVGQLDVPSTGAGSAGTADSASNQITGITWTPSPVVANRSSASGVENNFGELPILAISGAVIVDKNYNATQDPSESGLPGTTTVTLCRSQPAHNSACPTADIVSSVATTPVSGAYSFPGLKPGTYFVVETQPSGYGSSAPNTSAPIVLATSTIAGINFYETGAELKGVVYHDVDSNGSFGGGDLPIAGATVKLCKTSSLPSCATPVATTTTGSDGAYLFTGVPAPAAGEGYTIVEDETTTGATNPLNSYSNGTTTVGSLVGGQSLAPGSASGAEQGPLFNGDSTVGGISFQMPTAVVAGTPPVVGSGYNFGEAQIAPISGRVYVDRDPTSPGFNPTTDGGLLNGATTMLCHIPDDHKDACETGEDAKRTSLSSPETEPCFSAPFAATGGCTTSRTSAMFAPDRRLSESGACSAHR